MEKLIKIDDLGGKKNDFWKHPYDSDFATEWSEVLLSNARHI